MKTSYYLILIFLASLFSENLLAQVNLSGELRPRTEYAHGLKTLANPDQDAALFTTQRTRLNFGYKDETFTTSIVLQDVRTWGNQPQLVGNQSYATSIHQAWAELNLCSNFAIKLGRQELAYDNHRILGNVGWAQQARSHDLALLKYSGFVNAHLGLAYHQNGALNQNFYSGPDAYKAMQFLWLNKASDILNVSFLFLNNGVPYNTYEYTGGPLTKQKINYTQTIGTYSKLNLGPINLEGSLYYQTGKLANNNDLSALEFMLKGTLTIADMISVNAGYEYLSGTELGTSGKSTSFNPLYGTNHKFNGFMDYFYVGNHIGNVGLNDLFAGGQIKFDKLTTKSDLHIFAAAADINPNTGRFLGVELDLSLNYAFSNSASLAAGYSQMFGNHTMEHLKGGSYEEMTNWAYIMFTFTPQFIK